MKLSLENFRGFKIETKDGEKGKIKDFIFDEETWKIRYLEADFGTFFKDKRILLPIDVVTPPLWDSKLVRLDLTNEKIENSPAPDDIPTISRQYEKEVLKHYGYATYWDSGYIPPVNAGMYYPARPLNVPVQDISEKDMDSSLRSFKEVIGYHIHAKDGQLGHLEDLIADDSDWQLIYIIVDTSNWRPWSKKVILLIDWLKEISYTSKEVSLDVDTDFIKNAPEFDTEKPIDEAYEKSLLDYYKPAFPK
ncbi:MAG: PRC-barrel domain containing protein [Bacteroidetes bacterium]|nr:MAG: PRC-barrel domain containing protein [Bacteroidota bacterium]